MGRRAHFTTTARTIYSRPTLATVTIDRGSDTLAVRPYRQRRVYELPLATVAQMVVLRVVRAEVFARRLAKKKRP